MSELHPGNARSAARSAMSYSAAFDGKGIDWQNGQPWPHRMELAQALDWITELGAMVLNLADRADAAPQFVGRSSEELSALPVSWRCIKDADGQDVRVWRAFQLRDYARAEASRAAAEERQRWLLKADATHAEANAIFNADPSLTPQAVRDVIEWHVATLRVDEVSHASAEE